MKTFKFYTMVIIVFLLYFSAFLGSCYLLSNYMANPCLFSDVVPYFIYLFLGIFWGYKIIVKLLSLRYDTELKSYFQEVEPFPIYRCLTAFDKKIEIKKTGRFRVGICYSDRNDPNEIHYQWLFLKQARKIFDFSSIEKIKKRAEEETIKQRQELLEIINEYDLNIDHTILLELTEDLNT